MDPNRIQPIIEVLSRDIDERSSYHNHKEAMAWTAAAFYVVGVLVLAHEGSQLCASATPWWLAVIALVVLILAIVMAWFPAWLFIDMQFKQRWMAADEVGGLRRARRNLVEQLLAAERPSAATDIDACVARTDVAQAPSAAAAPSAPSASAPARDRGWPAFVQTEIEASSKEHPRERSFWRLLGLWRAKGYSLESRHRSELAVRWVLLLSTGLAVCEPAGRLIGLFLPT